MPRINDNRTNVHTSETQKNQTTEGQFGKKKVSKGITTQRVKEGVQSLINTVRSLFSRNVKNPKKEEAQSTTGNIIKSHPMPDGLPPEPPTEEGNAVAARLLKNPPPLPPTPTAIPPIPKGPAPKAPKKAALKSKVAKNVDPEQRAKTDAINAELATRKTKKKAGTDAPPALPPKPKILKKQVKEDQ